MELVLWINKAGLSDVRSQNVFHVDVNLKNIL